MKFNDMYCSRYTCQALMAYPRSMALTSEHAYVCCTGLLMNWSDGRIVTDSSVFHHGGLFGFAVISLKSCISHKLLDALFFVINIIACFLLTYPT